MTKALIGHTGFVGSNIKKQITFDDFYNSTNIEDIHDKSYNLVISAATPALRWKANQEPEEDLATIERLINSLKKVNADRFVLISTIDVYPNKNGVNENTKIAIEDVTEAYGKHRYMLENFIAETFDNHTILRCPQIYGENMKKGFIYDLMNDNALDFTDKDSQLQFYNAKNFSKDINVALENDLEILNLAVEPTTAAEVARAANETDFQTKTDRPPLQFDMQTIHAHLFNKDGAYLYNKEETLQEIKEFVQ